jgi:hypothetical protein
MYSTKNTHKCRVVKKVTDRGTFRCLKPANVTLILNAPEPVALCLDCAAALSREIAESVPGGKRDANR